jgi:glycosyltransferase involved in cell wall biosynthesis
LARIYSHFGQNNGCFAHRILWPVRYCGEEFSEHDWYLTTTDPVGDYDVYNLYGYMTPPTMACVGQWKRRGRKVVANFDDPLDLIPDWNGCQLSADNLGNYELSKDLADLIIASTPELAKRIGRPTKTVVARNLMEVASYGVSSHSPVDQKVRILWAGSNTHSKDLELADAAIDHVLTKWGTDKVEVIFVGAGNGKAFAKWLNRGLHFEPGVGLETYPKLLGFIKPQIVLAPLVDCDFNRCKSNIRCLEGFALAAPVIASPVGEYGRTVIHGETGYLASSDEDWIEALDELVGNETLREQMGNRGREYVGAYADWANPNCRGEWRQAWQRVLKLL